MRPAHFAFLSVFLISCSPSPSTIESNHARIEGDGSFLALSNQSPITSKSSRPRLRLIATVDSPTISSQKLQATDVHLVNHRAFISYNVAGETQMGAVDVIDVKKAERPTMESSLELPNHDANAIYRNGNTVYVVGAQDSGGAALLSIPYRANTLDTSFSSFALESYAGTDVVVSGDQIYVTSGDTGGLEIFEKSSATRKIYLSIKDARGLSVDHNRDSVEVVSGQPGALSQVTRDGLLSKTFELGGNTIAESKSTVETGKSTSLVSLGNNGWKLLCTETGQTLVHMEAVTVSGLDSTLTVTNAASMDDGLIFAANGQAGLYVYETKRGSKISGTKCFQIKAALLGSINFGEDISANHVVYKKNRLFIPAGLGGLKIVEVSRQTSKDDFDDFDDDFDDEDDKDD